MTKPSKTLPVLSRNIQSLRLHRQLSQSELAARSGLSPKTIYLIERGRHSPTVVTVESIAKALGVTLAALLVDLDAASTITRWLADLRKRLDGASEPLRESIEASIRRVSNPPPSTTTI